MIGALIASAGSPFAAGAAITDSAAQPAAPLRVIELFTSHGCSSCPPADALLGELLEQRDDLIALEWHVDYWDTLVHGGDGSWVDPFSNAAFTSRQRTYNNQPLRGRRGVYTPQAVINGEYAAVGSDSRNIIQALEEPLQASVAVSVARSEGGLLIDVEPLTGAAGRQADVAAGSRQATATPLPNADVWLVHYRNSAVTDITAGENRHLKLTNHHIVTGMQRVGNAADSTPRWQVAGPADPGHGCAVLVQSAAQAPLLGAASCP